MSPIRIFIGLLAANLFLAVALAAWWHFGFSDKLAPILLFAFIAGIGGFVVNIQVRKALRPFWQRPCAGFHWHSQFPDVPTSELREFLNLFVDAFAFSRKRLCSFRPDDKVMDIYRALYPHDGMADALELETFARDLKKRYDIDIAASWREDITLGEIYQTVRQSA